MVVPSTANSYRAAVSALRSLDGGRCEFPHLHAPGGQLCATFGEESGPVHAWERRPGGAGVPEHTCPGGHAAAFRPSWPGPHQGPPSHPHFIVSVARGPEVSRMRSITELCGLRVLVDTRLYASRVGALTSPVGAPPHGSSLSTVAAEVNTQRTTGAV